MQGSSLLHPLTIIKRIHTMKKFFIYSGVLLSMLSLAACDESFNDWADLKTNEATTSDAYGLNFTGSGVDVDMNSESIPDSVDIVSVAKSSDDIQKVVLKSVSLNGTDVTKFCVIKEATARMSTKQLDSIATVVLSSQKYEKRALDVDATAAGVLQNGTAVQVQGKVTQNETPIVTPDSDPKGYYILGDVNGNDWTPSNPVMMTETAEGSKVYKAVVKTTGNSNWFKFYGASTLKGEGGSQTTWDDANQAQYGCATNGDEATFNFVSWNDVQTPVIAGAGTWIVTFDAENWTYSVASPVLYMAGDANGWAQTEPLASNDGTNFWGFAYLNNNGFKFSTQKDWDGTNYGEGFSTAANAGNMSLPEGYNEGFYKIVLNLDGKTMELTPITTIGIIGDATPGGWNDDTDLTYNKDERCWEIKDVALNAGELKFRANDAWDINWGGTVDNLIQNGSNLKVDEGKYDIKLYAWADGYAKCELIKK